MLSDSIGKDNEYNQIWIYDGVYRKAALALCGLCEIHRRQHSIPTAQARI